MLHGSQPEPHQLRGPFWTPITPQTGSFFHAETQCVTHDLLVKASRRRVLAQPETAWGCPFLAGPPDPVTVSMLHQGEGRVRRMISASALPAGKPLYRSVTKRLA